MMGVQVFTTKTKQKQNKTKQTNKKERKKNTSLWLFKEQNDFLNLLNCSIFHAFLCF